MYATCYRSRLTVILVTLTLLAASKTGSAQENLLPLGAKPLPELCSKGVQAYLRDRTLWLFLDPNVVERKKVVLPRICSPIRSFGWKDHSDVALEFVPEPQQWVFSWSTSPAKSPVIEVLFDAAPRLPRDCLPASPAGDGSIMLHAHEARIFGEKLRYEPQWYKNTVGYWTIGTDYATWELTVAEPGAYSVAVLQGCGKGFGGSDAVITLRQGNKVKAELPFQTIDTGHFQNFRWHDLGTVHVADAGPYQLRIDAKRIARVALFDVRTIHLVRQAKSPE